MKHIACAVAVALFVLSVLFVYAGACVKSLAFALDEVARWLAFGSDKCCKELGDRLLNWMERRGWW